MKHEIKMKLAVGKRIEVLKKQGEKVIKLRDMSYRIVKEEERRFRREVKIKHVKATPEDKFEIRNQMIL